MYISASNDDHEDFPSELIRFSSQVAANTPSLRRSRRDRKANTTSLIPMNGQDLKALTSLFDREDVEEIVADVNNSLRSLLPEPCWDDNPFGFLGEYL